MSARHVGLAALAVGCSFGGPGPCAPARTTAPAADDDASQDTRDDGAPDLAPDAGPDETGQETGEEGGGGGAATGACPALPDGFEQFLAGDPEDVEVEPDGPAWLLLGGTPSPAEALQWWSESVAGGDVVVLQTTGGDANLGVLWDALAPVDSVEILSIQTPEHAASDAVSCRLERAEGVYVLGGSQSTYVVNWSDGPIPAALADAWARGAAIGGNSAGLAVMGEHAFAAHEGTIQSPEALADPYDSRVTIEHDFLQLPLGQGVLFDSHFAERDRMGRSFAFLARIIADGHDADPIGLGIDEDTALLVDASGLGEVLGEGSVYLLRPPGPPQLCLPGVALQWSDVQVFALGAGEQLWLPDGMTEVAPTLVSAVDGSLDPADPY